MKYEENNDMTYLARGKAAFDELTPLVQTLDKTRPMPTNAKTFELVAEQMLALGQWALEPTQRRRFQRLPLQEFNVTNIDLLVQSASAALALLPKHPAEASSAFEGLWTLMVNSYEDTRAAARFLFRHELEEAPPLIPVWELLEGAGQDQT